ncbi:hypothetical protein HYX17_04720 [Candidatus Woesearchaeota archaeon]|nr:hypothetical protein [Candidatus Woesearchaeota archaeon]
MKKGQAAIEFLMTYGWAILVVLVAISALWFFVGNPQSLVADNCRLAAPLNCEGATATATSITMRVRNGLTETITVTDVDLPDLTTGSCTAGSGSINAGAVGNVAVTCSGLSGKVRSAVTITYSTPGLTGRVITGNLVVTVA